MELRVEKEYWRGKQVKADWDQGLKDLCTFGARNL